MHRFTSYRRYGIPVSLAGITGCLWATPYLTSFGAGIAWIVPGLLVLIAGISPRLSPFQMGFLVGLYFNLTALYWLLFMPVRIAAIVAWLALSAYCAIYPALWSIFCWRMLPSPSTRQRAPRPFTQLFHRLSTMSWPQRQIWALIGATAWTSVEMLQSHLFTGFPWNLLGISQVELLPLIQLASVTGVYGVSFMVAWISLSLLLAIAQIANDPGKPLSWSREVLPAGTILAIIVSLGFSRIQASFATRGSLRLALVQPSVSQTIIWAGTDAESRITELFRLSAASMEHAPDLLLWPESGLPSMENVAERVSNFVRQHQVPLVFNDLELEQSADGNSRKIFNSAFLMNQAGQLIDSSRKRQLVLFGEYTPFANRFPFLDSLSPIGMSLSQGTEPGLLTLESLQLTMGTLICFEDAFPALGRDTAQLNPDFLVNLTNDAWFGESQAQWQHAHAATFRAIETGLPLIRCANNGITCWIDPFGRLQVGTPSTPRDVYKPGYKIMDIPMRKVSADSELTQYARDGDLFGWMCVCVSFALLFIRELFRMKGSTHDFNFDTDLLRDSI